MNRLKFAEFISSTGKIYLIRTNKRKVKVRDYDELSLNAKYFPMILRELVAKPSGLKVDDFSSFRELMEVCKAAVTLSGVSKPGKECR
ncbi:hypothetical protein ACFQ38_16180 [Sporosarcina contaminans]|uniref:Uncharacterized protein n=1 Tax=Sporosarcina contaminans TaxID=633403 RepID=A0ABW3U1S1_9BACL